MPHLEVLVVPHVAVGGVRLRHQRPNVVDRQVFGPTENDGFEVLRTHDGPHPGTAGISGPIRIDGGEADQILAGGPDDGHLDFMRAEPFFDEAFRLQTGLAGQFRDRNDADLLLVDEQHGKLVSAAGNAE